MKLLFLKCNITRFKGFFYPSYIHIRKKNSSKWVFAHQSAEFRTTNIVLLVTCFLSKSDDPMFFILSLHPIAASASERFSILFLIKLVKTSTSTPFNLLFTQHHIWLILSVSLHIFFFCLLQTFVCIVFHILFHFFCFFFSDVLWYRFLLYFFIFFINTVYFFLYMFDNTFNLRHHLTSIYIFYNQICLIFSTWICIFHFIYSFVFSHEPKFNSKFQNYVLSRWQTQHHQRQPSHNFVWSLKFIPRRYQ